MKRNWFRKDLDVSARAASMKKQQRTAPFTALRLQELEEREVPATLVLASGNLTLADTGSPTITVAINTTTHNYTITDSVGFTGSAPTGFAFSGTGNTTATESDGLAASITQLTFNTTNATFGTTTIGAATGMTVTDAGSVTISGALTGGTTGNLSITAAGSIADNASITLTTGTIAIAADTAGSGTAGFTQASSGATITTTNTGASALAITVNTANGGTGNASIRTIADSGTLTINTYGGSILYSGTDNYSSTITSITEAAGSQTATVTPAGTTAAPGATGFYAGETVTISGTGGIYDGTYTIQNINWPSAAQTAAPSFTITTTASGLGSVSSGTVASPTGVLEAEALGVVGSDNEGTSPTGDVAALHYTFATTGAGSIGTASRPIQSSAAASNTVSLSAGSGGVYFVDWNNPVTLSGATATGAGNVYVVTADSGGHNLTVAGNVSTGSGNIILAADDNFVVNSGVIIGGAGFSGTVYMACNRDQGNTGTLTLTGSTITTSNNSVYNNTGSQITSTPGAVLLEDYSAAGTAAGAITLGNITAGSNGSITATTIPTLGIYDATATAGAADIVMGSASNVLTAGTVNLIDQTGRASSATGGVGTSASPINVSAANVNITNTGSGTGTNASTDTAEAGIYVNDAVAGNFSAAVSGNSTGSISLTTASGVLNIAGAISTGGGPITLNGAGGVTVNAPLGNGTSGAITINGTLTGSAGIVLSGGLTVNQSANSTFAGAISGNGGLTITGSGTLTLSNANNSYTGATTINAGTLAPADLTATSGVTVGSGGTLAGSGTVNTSAAVSLSGGTVYPGGTAGILNAGSLSASTTGSLAVQLTNAGSGAGIGFDQLDVTGTVTLTGITPIINVGSNPTIQVGNSFEIISNDGTDAVVGNFAGSSTILAADNPSYQFTYSTMGGDGNDVVLTLIAISPPRQLDVSGGTVAYTTSAAINSNITLTQSTTSHTYTFTDTSGPITLSSAATTAGWSGGGTTTVTGPDTSITNFNINTTDGTDTFNGLDAGSATLTVSLSSGISTLNGTTTSTTGDIDITGAGNFVLAGIVTTGGNLNVTSTGNVTLSGTETPTGNITLSGFNTLSVAGTASTAAGTISANGTTITEANSGTLSAPTVTLGATSMGAAGNGILVQTANLNVIGGASAAYVTSENGTTLAATASGSGAINVSNQVGTLTVSSLSGSQGAFNLSSSDDIVVPNSLSATGAALSFSANTDGSGSQGFTQSSGTITASSLSITVNTPAGGTGNASFDSVTVGGALSVNSNGGNVVYSNPAMLNASQLGTANGGMTPSFTLVASSYIFTATGAGGIGSSAEPIQSNVPVSNTISLSAGSGGIYWTDWANPVFLTGATATGAGNIQIVSANASGHDLNVNGPVTTGSGSIYLAADDNLNINAPIGGSGFSGTVYIAANRDLGNTLQLDMNAGSSIMTSNATASAVDLEGYSISGTATGGIVLNNIKVGNGGTITVNTDTGILTPAGTSNGSIEPLNSSVVLTAGSAGTVVLIASPYPVSGNNGSAYAIGTPSVPLLVSAGNVVINSQASTPSNPALPTESATSNGSVYVTGTGPTNFAATVSGTNGYTGSLNLATTSGILTINGPTSTNQTTSGINLTSTGTNGGIVITGVLDSPTSGNIVLNAGTNTVTLDSTLTLNSGQTLTTTANGGTTVATGGIFAGTGTTVSPVTLLSGSTISPAGTGVGTLNVADVTGAAGATFRFDVLDGPNTAGNDYDLLASTGTVNLAGSTLQFYLGSNYTPNMGDTFNIITASNVTGMFAGGTTPFAAANNSGVVLTPTYTSTGVSLQVTNILTPTLDVENGVLTYNGGGNVINNLTIDYSASTNKYTFTESVANDITLGNGAVALGYTGNGTNVIVGSAASLTAINITLGAGSDTLVIDSLATALSADGGGQSTDTALINGTLNAGANFTLTGFDEITAAAASLINVGAGTVNLTALDGVGTSTQSILAQAGTVNVTAEGSAGGGDYLSDANGGIVNATDVGTGGITVTNGSGTLNFTGIDTGGGNITVVETTGTLNIAGATSTDTGNISLTSGDAVTLGASLNAGSGTIAIAANTDGSGSQGFDQEGTTITTTNSSTSALTITVNTVSGGTGNAVIGQESIGSNAGGTVTIISNGGSILWSSNAVYPASFNTSLTGTASGGSNAQVLRANDYVLTATGAGTSIGTTARPIQTDSFAGADSTADAANLTLAANSGGIFVTDWGSNNNNDITVDSAIATGAGSIRVVAANAGGHNLFVDGPVSTGSGSIALYADDDLIFTANAKIGGSGFSGTVDLEEDRDDANGEFFYMDPNSSIVTSNSSSGASTPAVQILGFSAGGSNDTVVTTNIAGGGLELGNITVGAGGTILADAIANPAGQGSIVQQPGTLLSTGGTGSLILITAATDVANSANASGGYAQGEIGYSGLANAPSMMPINTDATTITATTVGTSLINTGMIAIDDTGAATITANVTGNATGSIVVATAAGVLTLRGSTNTSGGSITLTGAGGVVIPAGATLGSSGTGGMSINGPLSGSGAITEGNGTVTLTQATDSTYGGVISGNQMVYFEGVGGVTFTNAQTYTGSTNIDFGTLRVNGSLAASSAVNVGVSGSIEGTGTIGTAVIDGNIGAGSGPGAAGTFHAAAVSFGSSGPQTDTVDINGAVQYDQLAVSGTLDLNYATLNLEGSYVPASGNTFTIITAGNLPNQFSNAPDGTQIPFNGRMLTIHYTATTVTLTAASSAPSVSRASINAFNPDTHLADAAYEAQRSRVTDIELTFNGPVSASTFATQYPTTLSRTDTGASANTTLNPNVIQTYTGTPPPTGDKIIVTQVSADVVDLTFAPVSGTSDAALHGSSLGGYSLTDGGWTLTVGNGQGVGVAYATPDWRTTGTGANGTAPFTGLYALFGDYGALGTVDASFAQGAFVSALGISYDNSGTTANGFNAAFDFDGTQTVQAGVAQGAFVNNFGITLT